MGVQAMASGYDGVLRLYDLETKTVSGVFGDRYVKKRMLLVNRTLPAPQPYCHAASSQSFLVGLETLALTVTPS